MTKEISSDWPMLSAKALASLPQELERDGGGALCGALRISPVLLDEVRPEGRGDFVRRLQRPLPSLQPQRPATPGLHRREPQAGGPALPGIGARAW